MRFWKTKPNPDLELVGTLKGVKIYHKKNLFELPSDRVFACLREAYYVNNWSASKEEVKKYIDGLEEAFNSSKLADVGTFIKILKIKVDRQPQERSLTTLASKYFYLANEPNSLEAKFLEQKKELFEDVEEAGFFLDFALQSLTDYRGFADSDSNIFLRLLEESTRKEKSASKK